jgi:hypothetical protein
MVLVGREDTERVDEDWLREARWIVREQDRARSTFEETLRTRGFDPARMKIAMTLPSNEAVAQRSKRAPASPRCRDWSSRAL